MRWFAIFALVWALKLCLTLGSYWALQAATNRWRESAMRASPRLGSPPNCAGIFQAGNPAQPWYVRLHGKIVSLKSAHFKFSGLDPQRSFSTKEIADRGIIKLATGTDQPDEKQVATTTPLSIPSRQKAKPLPRTRKAVLENTPDT
jgi:hypothetical protein